MKETTVMKQREIERKTESMLFHSHVDNNENIYKAHFDIGTSS